MSFSHGIIVSLLSCLAFVFIAFRSFAYWRINFDHAKAVYTSSSFKLVAGRSALSSLWLVGHCHCPQCPVLDCFGFHAFVVMSFSSTIQWSYCRVPSLTRRIFVSGFFELEVTLCVVVLFFIILFTLAWSFPSSISSSLLRILCRLRYLLYASVIFIVIRSILCFAKLTLCCSHYSLCVLPIMLISYDSSSA